MSLPRIATATFIRYTIDSDHGSLASRGGIKLPNGLRAMRDRAVCVCHCVHQLLLVRFPSYDSSALPKVRTYGITAVVVAAMGAATTARDVVASTNVFFAADAVRTTIWC